MLNTRNIRLVVAVLAILGIITFFATSRNSIGESIQRVNKPAANSDIELGKSSSNNNEIIDDISQQEPIQPPPQKDVEDDESKNTLQGSPHVGTKAPYEKDDKPKKIIAEKLTPENSNNEISGSNDVQKITTPKQSNFKGEACNDVDYVIMIDAGSSGSRVHVYEFNTCVQPPRVLSEEFKMLEPGLSSYDTDTVGAAKSLDPLLEVALQKVPKNKQKCTPIAVKATAGLRLLGEAKSEAILQEVKRHLLENYPFAVVPGDGISILDGKDEGVYAWVTANFLLGNIGNKDKLPTAAVFDLGGGSTQIVFEPEYKDQIPVEGETKHKFSFGEHDFTLYQFSHLGYGLMQGRNKINKLILEKHLKKDNSLTSYKSKKEAKEAVATTDLLNPCIAPEVIAKNVQVEVADDEIYVVNMKGPSQASGGSQCRFLAEQILNKEASCDSKPCSFNGVHQPSLTHAFNKNSDMFIFSFFYDRTTPIGMPSSFTVEELRDLTKSVCSGESMWKDFFLDDHLVNLNENPQWCLDLSFITAMLHTGYDIPLNRELRTAKKIDNNELGWCLGASLPLLDKTNPLWKCRD
ncbi:GDA1 [Candida jiufengensis]|uniref:GDA1 n=1 Tax=Candida jiufengensis TaxID=497108 RepID=UPI002224EA9C|nr:GDA1 [Candida jiufengensis]KAI5952631.1 GDA1 [Candida jiufengensis]